MKTNILILAANPIGTEPLQLEREINFIQEKLESSSQRDRFEILPGTVVARSQDLQSKLRKREPRIVHFCGHGEGEAGLVLENDAGEPHFVTEETLERVFALFSEQIECVVLNACYTAVQAKAIAKHINFVIGMSQPIADCSAIAFSKEFYGALGDGKSILDAYEFGCNQIDLEPPNLALGRNASKKHLRDKIPEDLIPKLFVKENPCQIKQIEAETVSASPPLTEAQKTNLELRKKLLNSVYRIWLAKLDDNDKLSSNPIKIKLQTLYQFSERPDRTDEKTDIDEIFAQWKDGNRLLIDLSGNKRK